MTSELRDALRALFGERVVFEVAMARHTSLRVGGPADAVANPSDCDEVVACLALCRRR